MVNTDVIIVGAGPSGITAAIYLKRAGVPFIIIEKSMPGGKVALTSTVENYPGYAKIDGVDLALKFQDQLNKNEIELTFDNITKIEFNNNNFVLEGDFDTYKAKYVIVATGTKERKLELENEEKFYGRGISFCAICDGSLYKGKDVAVIGGGNSALEEALYLSTIVNKVYLIHRRNEFRADAILQEKVKNTDNIVIYTPYNSISLIGENKIEGLIIKEIDGEEESISLDGIFVYIGNVPNTDFLKLDYEQMNGYILVDENMQTSFDRLYAVGDVRSKKLRQIVTAVNDGAIAAISIEKDIKSKSYNVFVNKYNIENAELTEEIKDEITGTINMSSSVFIDAYENIETKTMKPIMENIIYEGMHKSLDRILKGENKDKKSERNNLI